MALGEWISGVGFRLVHKNNLVYNTCWEDPRLDRVALDLSSDDNVLVITSAGCNTLDYVLDEPQHVYAVDMNPRQNALLELKIAAIRSLDFDSFFDLFGRGRLDGIRDTYAKVLRPQISPRSRLYWDRRISFFSPLKKRSFYFRGTSGMFARFINMYIDRVVRIRGAVNDMINASDLGEQRSIYDTHVQPKIWTKPLRFAMRRDATLSLLGVPREQRKHLESHYHGGILSFVEDCLQAVFWRLSLTDNYFWRVYLTGEYTPDCCPEYLRPENFDRLRSLVDRISVHTNSVEGFLNNNDVEISRYVLLDHMDWLSTPKRLPLLESEWQAILRRGAPQTRILWRSGGLRTDFVDDLRVTKDGEQLRMGELLTYDRELARELHQHDRVHTYGSFYIADMAA